MDCNKNYLQECVLPVCTRVRTCVRVCVHGTNLCSSLKRFPVMQTPPRHISERQQVCSAEQKPEILAGIVHDLVFNLVISLLTHPFVVRRVRVVYPGGLLEVHHCIAMLIRWQSRPWVTATDSSHILQSAANYFTRNGVLLRSSIASIPTNWL